MDYIYGSGSVYNPVIVIPCLYFFLTRVQVPEIGYRINALSKISENGFKFYIYLTKAVFPN